MKAAPSFMSASEAVDCGLVLVCAGRSAESFASWKTGALSRKCTSQVCLCVRAGEHVLRREWRKSIVVVKRYCHSCQTEGGGWVTEVKLLGEKNEAAPISLLPFAHSFCCLNFCEYVPSLCLLPSVFPRGWRKTNFFFFLCACVCVFFL